MNLLLQAQAQGGGSMSFLIMMVAIFAIMWFFMIRPQQKKQKEIRKFQNSLQEGSKVVTGGGVYGTVKHINLEQNTVDVEVARGVVITVAKNYVFADATAQVNAQAKSNIQGSWKLFVQFAEQGVSDFFVLSLAQRCLLVDDGTQ